MTIRNHRVRWSRLVVDGTPKVFLSLEDLLDALDREVHDQEEHGDVEIAAALSYVRESFARVPDGPNRVDAVSPRLP